MSSFTIRSGLIAVAIICNVGAAAAQPAGPFNDNAFVSRDSAGNVTALFADLKPMANAPEQIDVITFYGPTGSAAATIQDVPVWKIPFSRRVVAARPNLLSPAQQVSIRGATRVTFTVGSVMRNATLSPMCFFIVYPEEEIGTGHCPNCVYLCPCDAEVLTECVQLELVESSGTTR
jgi:hypothetical protein